MNSLPFFIRGVYTGFVDLEGIARIEGQVLVLEFRTRHVLARLVRSQPKEVRVPLAELEEVAFRRRFLMGYLCLRARRMSSFNAVPGSDGAELRLRCRRAHWQAARELASNLDLGVVTQNLKAMVDAHTPPDALPPGPPPLPGQPAPPA